MLDQITVDLAVLIKGTGIAFAIGVALLRFNKFLLIFRRFRRSWRSRALRTVWGIRNGERVRVVCSELPAQPHSDSRQFPEERQFIYLNKYGDVDALFEVVTTLIVLYPDSEIRVMSADEQATSTSSGDYHLVLVGGPDYNALADAEIDAGRARIRYIDPASEALRDPEEESALYDPRTGRRYYEPKHRRYPAIDADVGYFERYPAICSNGYTSKYNVVLIGGPNTVGVTGAAKAFAAFRVDGKEPSPGVLHNAAVVQKRLGLLQRLGLARSRLTRLVVTVKARKEHASVQVPIVCEDDVVCETSRGSLAAGSGSPKGNQGPIRPPQQLSQDNAEPAPRSAQPVSEAAGAGSGTTNTVVDD